MFESKNNYSLNDLSAALSWGDGGGRKQLPLPPSPDASKILSCAVLRKVGIVIHGGSLHLVFGFMGAFCVVVVRGDLFDFVWVFCCLLLFAQFLSGWNEESQGCFQKTRILWLRLSETAVPCSCIRWVAGSWMQLFPLGGHFTADKWSDLVKLKVFSVIKSKIFNAHVACTLYACVMSTQIDTFCS